MNEFELPIVVILCIWSAVLVWASRALLVAARELDTEREALSRWTRIRRVAERQNVKWQ
jgi:hypothetical protein